VTLTIFSLGDVIQNWKLRYFRLKAPYLYYFEDIKATKPKGVINLHGATVDLARNRAGKTEHKFCFEVHVPSEKRTYLINANGEEDLAGWVNTIQLGTLYYALSAAFYRTSYLAPVCLAEILARLPRFPDMTLAATGSPPSAQRQPASNDAASPDGGKQYLQATTSVPKSPSTSSASEDMTKLKSPMFPNAVAAEQAAIEKAKHINTTTTGNAVISTSVGPGAQTIVSTVEAQASPEMQGGIIQPRPAAAPAAYDRSGLVPSPTMATWLANNTVVRLLLCTPSHNSAEAACACNDATGTPT
jgi:hypothetical protein